MTEPSIPAATRFQESNGLGIAGFVLSLVGICSGGILSPIGLILSLVALGKQPKGFAIAGVVIGALGSCGIISALLLAPVAIAAVLAALGLTAAAVALGGPEIEAKVEMATLSVMVEHYHDTHDGKYPLTLEEATTALDADSRFRSDHWHHPYIYQLKSDGSDYRLFSSGPDGLPHTNDDIFLDDDENWPTTPTTPTTPPSNPDPASSPQ